MNQTFPSFTVVSKSAPRATTCSPFSSEAVATVRAAAKSTRHATERIDAIVIDWLVEGIQGTKQRIEVVLIKGRWSRQAATECTHATCWLD
jgi:hypothetical protein